MDADEIAKVPLLGGRTLDWDWHARQPGHVVRTMGRKIGAPGPIGQPFQAWSWHVCIACGEKSEPVGGYCW